MICDSLCFVCVVHPVICIYIDCIIHWSLFFFWISRIELHTERRGCIRAFLNHSTIYLISILCQKLSQKYSSSIFYSSIDYESMTWIVKVNLNNFLCNSRFNCVYVFFRCTAVLEFFRLWLWFYLFSVFAMWARFSFLGDCIVVWRVSIEHIVLHTVHFSTLLISTNVFRFPINILLYKNACDETWLPFIINTIFHMWPHAEFENWQKIFIKIAKIGER